ncbi:helix-turn-helix domain-containing protein [Hymenobacter sp. HMF4947]|uniref:Helix-turn-helix domain-containing protein n=1 Tax=Hymenobacter ginkgonis TaxID=2682976 RepID=A0A7K1TCC2_9BACT|nr:AraC family transcriptional regulator [Hymenobacter ginkgonis]MVN76023.1 helix-turn-helix domain-containing protein [Hymenobacter ginkgonis]
MTCLTQHEALVVEEIDAATWNAPQPLRDHFALVLIRRGSGTYLPHGHNLPYQPGTLLLLGPADCYHFAIDQPTRFGQLRFTEAYLASLTATGPHAAAWQQLRDVGQHTALGPAGYFAQGAAEPQLSALLTILFTEYGHRPAGHAALASSLMGAVLSFVGRQLAPPLPVRRGAPSYAASVVQRLLAYIRHHIAEPDRLRVEELASAFAYSPSHLSELFRQETGESLRQYIVRYRLWLAESRLELSTLPISQIADELGFVDVCHLNKLFKKRYRLTPTAYRRQLVGGTPHHPTPAYALR